MKLGNGYETRIYWVLSEEDALPASPYKWKQQFDIEMRNRRHTWNKRVEENGVQEKLSTIVWQRTFSLLVQKVRRMPKRSCHHKLNALWGSHVFPFKLLNHVGVFGWRELYTSLVIILSANVLPKSNRNHSASVFASICYRNRRRQKHTRHRKKVKETQKHVTQPYSSTLATAERPCLPTCRKHMAAA